MRLCPDRTIRCATALATLLGTLALAGCSSPSSAVAERRLCFDQEPTIVGTAGADTLRGTPGPDVIDAGDGHDVVYAGGGRDLVCDGPGDDRVYGEQGDDRFAAGEGSDEFFGDNPGAEPQINWVTYAGAPGGVSIDLRKGFATSGSYTDKLTGIVNASGSEYADEIKGGPGWNLLGGGCGDDVVSGRAGPDRLYGSYRDGPDCDAAGSSDDDIMHGGSGDDVADGVFYTQTGDDTFYGEDGDDTLVSNGQHETFVGGPGRDLFTAQWTERARGPLRLDLVSHEYTYPDQTGEIYGVEDVSGTTEADVLRGDEDRNKLVGGRGAPDIAYGGPGEDDCRAEIRHRCE